MKLDYIFILHRVYAYKLAEVTEIDCDVREGGYRDAILHSVGANGKHGLRRTNADKRKAALMTIAVAEEVFAEKGERWSNYTIAEKCGVSEWTIRDYIKNSNSSLRDSRSDTGSTYIDKHGNISTMNTANIGKSKQPEQGEEKTYSLHCVADDPEYMNYKNEVLTPE